MSDGISRRDLGKLAAGAAVAAATGLPGTSEAHDIFPGAHGAVLTYAPNRAYVWDCYAQGGYNLMKYVTGWGMPNLGAEIGWCVSFPRVVIVRTQTGDGTGSAGTTRLYPDPNAMQSQVTPWYNARNSIWIEIGNEPNGAWIDANGNQISWDENLIWSWRYWLDQCITRARSVFPNAKLISPGLTPAAGSNPGRWMAIAADVMNRCDYIGWHVYGGNDWYSSGDLQRMVPLMKQYFSAKQWVLTEYGLNGTGVSAYTRGQRNAGFIHKGQSNPVIPSNNIASAYYHLCTDKSIDANYCIYPDGDRGYKSITG